MTIVLTGGGTGGHITPLLAVAKELKSLEPGVRIVYIGEQGSAFTELTADNPDIDEVRTVLAGKFRRYHGQSWLTRLLDVKTNLLNIRDLFYFLIGTVQSYLLLKRIKPQAAFLKGGFVGVPVGLAAAACKVPFVTHDSDVIPGLANRLVGRWARLHAVAGAAEEYAYPPAATRQVGVIVESHFSPVGAKQQDAFKQQIGAPTEARILLVTGGSSGAQRINEAIVTIADSLLSDYQDLLIVHQAGKGKSGCYGTYTHPRLEVLEFMRPMYAYTGAADVVVARASANTLAELGTQQKAVIAVPSQYLAGGHQLRNAEWLARHEAALTVVEQGDNLDATELDDAIRQLLDNAKQRQELAANLSTLTIPDAARQLAVILLDNSK